MKPFRITLVLLALMVLPLFATQALASFVPTLYDVYPGRPRLISAYTDTVPVIGFIIPSSQNGKHLSSLKLKSYIERERSVELVKIWKESNGTAGWQGTDTWVRNYNTSSILYDIGEIITIGGMNVAISGEDTFYVTFDAFTSAVNANRSYYHGYGLEVVIDTGYIKLAEAPGDTNTGGVFNPGWNGGAGPPYFSTYTLVFDTKGPDFDLNFCFEVNSCSTEAYYDIEPYIRVPMIDQGDSLRLCAFNVEADIDSSEGIHIIGWVHLLGHVSSKHMFGVEDLTLECPNDDPWGCDDGDKGDPCDSCWSRGFMIPDQRNTGGFNGVDADTGHWAICAWAEDTLGNSDTVCLEHANLPYRIDTQKPIIDEITWEFTPYGDLNGDGKIGLGDSIMIIAKGLSNPIEPLKECVQMRVDTSWMAGTSYAYPDGEWAVMSDTLQENNRIFRRIFCLKTPVPGLDSTNCPVNFLVEAWDNACNYDTLRDSICGTIDLDPPTVTVTYAWQADLDTMWHCMSIGDSVLIRANVGGTDIVSVTAMMDSMGIDSLMRHAMPLPYRSGDVYDTIWAISKPPILYGKDRDNTEQPDRDSIYRAWVTACDDAGNCVTDSGDLNSVMDTRRPRPIGYSQFCPDSTPCALVAQSLPGGRIELVWDTACDENDAYAFYVWASGPGESEFDSMGYTDEGEQLSTAKYWRWHSEPLEEGYWRFKIQTEDNCSNVGPFSCVVGAYADSTPPHVCIAVPDSGLTFGSWFPVKAVADSASHDAESAWLWYRLRPDLNDPPLGDAGQWTKCLSASMYRPDDGIVFLDSVHCLEGVEYIGWVEMIVVACDEVGNCQDTTSAWEDACLVDDDVFRPGHFLFYWDTLAPGVHLVSVNGFPSPQSACGFDVDPDTMNEVVIDVDGATAADSFEVEVRGPCDGFECRIFHQDFVTMPCTIWVSVDGWPEGTQYLYINVKDYDNGKDADLQVELCVPPQAPDHCIYISRPHEWMRIPCTGTSGYNCVKIEAEVYDYYQCRDVLFTEARFEWSLDGIAWLTIEDVIGSGPWETCWDNTGLVEHGDTVYFRVIAHDEFYMADTSYMVKVFVDCEQPQVSLRIEELYYTCGNHDIPKISCDPLTLKAVLEDTLIDISAIRFFFKRHSEPDIHEYWIPIDGWAEPAWSDNIWMYYWEEPCCPDERGFGGQPPIGCMYPNDYWDIRVAARDIAGHYMFDYDEDGFFDDSTFNDAVAFGSGITVYLDNEAPQPAISLVCDQGHEPPICIVNPSTWLGGTGNAYVQAGHDITAEISVLPSEDTCEVMKVHWYLGIDQNWVHVGTSFDPLNYPVTFNPLTDGLIPPYELEDGWWEGPLMAELHDSLGNISTDEITLYILDVTPTQAIITSPLNESYVWGNVPLRAMAINGYDICKLCYEFRPEGDSVWYPVNGGYPNACIIRQGFEEPVTGPGIKITSGAGIPSNPGDNCGNPLEINLPGDLPYHEFGQTTCGRNDDDNDGCLNAWDGAEDIYYKLIVTQSVDLDIRIDPYDTKSTGMAIGGECPLHGYCQYKSTNYDADPHGWTCVHLEPGTYWLQVDGRWDGPSCIELFDLSIIQHGFPLEWLTLNTVPDGAYYLRAVATDCSNNEDKNPRTIRVTVANELPTAFMEYPATACTVICPDSPEDTIGYVHGTVDLYATYSSTIPVNRVEFYYKSIFGYPTTYTLIGTDYFPTGDKYSVQWNTGSMYGRYHLMARVYNAAGRYGDSEPIEIGVDNSAPFSQIISIDGNSYPNGMDITKGDVIDIELVAIDSTSDEGWTRCYNSGLASIEVCIENCKTGQEITKCFEVTPVTDGFHTVQWNTSGLEFTGCSGCYYLYVKATDCLGNTANSSQITVYVSDITAPITTIGGFDGNNIYGYSDEKVSTLLFEYADSGSTNWIPIGWSDTLRICFFQGSPSCNSCPYYLYKTSWDPNSLANGVYQVRVISHDTCSNQDDSMAPWAFIHVLNGDITPYNPDFLGDLSFEKNWCVGGMHGIVRQTSSAGTPVVIARYNATYECVDMQHPQDPYDDQYAGSFFASAIEYGGPAKFFSSVTVAPSEEPMTGEPAAVTYLTAGSFDVVQVKRDVGTHGTYQQGCVEVTIPAGAVGGTFTYDRYIWVAPTVMPWVPVTQPDIKPIGDNNGYATYVSFTDCYYCCGWWSSHFGDDQGTNSGAGVESSDDCCFNPGRWAKIKMCYDTTVTTSKEHLAVMWWDCKTGQFKYNDIALDILGVEGFNTEQHYVEFATTCLNGPFAVVEILERPCEGTIVVSLREQDIQPYCNGYTNTTPTFIGLVTDNHPLGTDWINRNTIKFKLDLYEPGRLITIFDSLSWANGFGGCTYSGHNTTSGIFKACWSTSSPADPLAEGDHIATLTAQNKNVQTCTDTVHFMVDATAPKMWFADSVGAWVGANPHLCFYFTDSEAGVDKSSIWIDIYGDETTSPDPNSHSPIGTLSPDQLNWVDDTTACVDFTFDYDQCGYLHIFVYGGPDSCRCGGECAYPDFYDYKCGIADCVGNYANFFWQYYSVDAQGPDIAFVGASLCDRPLKFEITDRSCYHSSYPGSGSGIHHVYVYEDSTLVDSISQDPHNPDFWWYSPSEGVEHVDIKAVDNLDNQTVYSFELTVDCVPPVVSFIPGFVNCVTPTVKIVVSDAGTGVMWDSVKVDLYYWWNLLETYYASGPNQWTRSGDTLTVVGDGARLGISDGYDLYAVVYHEKTGVTSYSKGPKDLAGNWTPTQWIQQSYRADCYGPSITWKNSSYPCERPIKLQITDAKSGVATVMLYQDNEDMTSSLAYDTSSGLWLYTPSAGKHTLDVIATDVVGNATTYTFDVKDDCQGPAVSFYTGYVTKNPTIMFTVTDPSGVDWTTVNARVSGCSEECYYEAPALKDHVNTETGEVTLGGCNLDCSDGEEVETWVYSGTSYTGIGPADLTGNYLPKYAKCSFVVDAVAPSCYVNSLSGRPIVITLTDSKSGIDWSTLEFYEDSLLICEGLTCEDTTVKIDTDKGTIEYMPPAGRLYVEIYIKDKAGNQGTSCSFYTEEEQLSFKDPHNYPNPFDPREMRTTIVLGLSKSAYVTAKIYDFAGEYVTTLAKDDWCGTSSSYWLHWNATTEDGTPVADGTYLCYIKARDEDGAIKTAVIKIAVLKKDK